MEIKLLNKKHEVMLFDNHTIQIDPDGSGGHYIAIENIAVNLEFKAKDKKGDKKEFSALYFCLPPGFDGSIKFGFKLESDNEDYSELAEFCGVDCDVIETLRQYENEARKVFIKWFKAQKPFKEILPSESLANPKLIVPKDWV